MQTLIHSKIDLRSHRPTLSHSQNSVHTVQVFKPHQPIQPANNHLRPPISRAIKVLRVRRHPVAVTGNYYAAVSALRLVPTETFSHTFPRTFHQHIEPASCCPRVSFVGPPIVVRALSTLNGVEKTQEEKNPRDEDQKLLNLCNYFTRRKSSCQAQLSLSLYFS